MPESYEAILSKQLSMTQQLWNKLQESGVTDKTELKLDFAFDAPSQQAAESLHHYLVEETDYEVKIESAGVFKKTWRLTGTTQPTTLSEEILKQWVDWMVAAGLKFECVFDGWGTELP